MRTVGFRQLAVLVLVALAGPVSGATPSWLRELAAAPVSGVTPETDGVQLLRDEELVVSADGRMRKRVRGAVRILRREGLVRAGISVPQDTWSSVKDMRAWLIPASGKHVELGLKDATETTDVDGVMEIASDHRMKVLGFRQAAPGAVIGYEFEIERSPLQLSDTFAFQDTIPVREARYSLKLPPGWNVAPTWLNHAEVKSAATGAQQWQWSIKDVPPVAVETAMPAWWSVAGHLFLAFSPQGNSPQLSTWAGIGSWFDGLSKERRTVSEPMRSKIAELVAGKTSQLEKIRALAVFAQRDIRYVSIQLGIGGYQPHAAADVFRHRYGDCKDKATLLGVMLREIGIESIPVIVNNERTYVRTDTPPSLQFNHVILAIRLPRTLKVDSLLATSAAGDEQLLYFDPTDELTPFGRIRGDLQGSVGLLAQPEDSRLVTLPQLLPEHSGNRRMATFTLDGQGVLTGEIRERISGQEALLQRGFLRSAAREIDVNKVVEARLAESLASFQLSSATSRNREASEQPLEWDYRISAASYARRSGDLLMVRPRVVGVQAFNLPDDKPRVHDLMLSEPRRNQDEVIMELPAGYVVDSLPQPVEIDAGFATYSSRSEVAGSRLKYTRTYEVRALTVPASKVEEFRRLHREIARDERAVVVLRKAVP